MHTNLTQTYIIIYHVQVGTTLNVASKYSCVADDSSSSWALVVKISADPLSPASATPRQKSLSSSCKTPVSIVAVGSSNNARPWCDRTQLTTAFVGDQLTVGGQISHLTSQCHDRKFPQLVICSSLWTMIPIRGSVLPVHRASAIWTPPVLRSHNKQK